MNPEIKFIRLASRNLSHRANWISIPAKISIGGITWTSHVPEDASDVAFINRCVREIVDVENLDVK